MNPLFLYIFFEVIMTKVCAFYTLYMVFLTLRYILDYITWYNSVMFSNLSPII